MRSRRPAGVPFLRVALLWVAFSALLSGCVERAEQPAAGPQSAMPSGPGPTEIRFAYWALSPREISTVHRLVAEFEARRPAVKVQLIEVSDRYYEKLETLFATGNAPDVLSINYGRLGDFCRQGLLADLSPLLPGRPELDRSRFVAAAYESFASVGPTVGRPGLYALPRDWGPTNLLAFDKDAFDAAALPYPSSGYTWQDFASACRKLTVRHDGTIEQYGAAVCLYPYAFAAWVHQNDGVLLSENGDLMAIGERGSVGAVRFLKGLVDERVIAPPSAAHDESADEFLRGKVAMAFVTPYNLATLREAKGKRWGIAPPLEGARRVTGCIPTGIAMSVGCREAEAAMDFAEYWVTAAGEVASAGYCVPAWRPALDSSAMETGFGPEAAAVLRSAATYARPYPVSRLLPYELMLDHVKYALDEVFVKGADPGRALLREQENANVE